MTDIPEGFKLDTQSRLWLPGDVFYRDAWAAAHALKTQEGSFRQIYCLARGGYPFAAVVGNCFGVNNIPSLMVQSYAGTQQSEVKVLGSLPMDLLEHGGEGLLVLDDLFDTGKTVQRLKEFLPNAYFAAVYAKPAGKAVASYFYREIPDVWIVFPWEQAPEAFTSA